MNRRPQLELITPSPSPEEAAAVVAALEQFMRNHAPVIVEEAPTGPTAWQLATLREGVNRAPDHPPFWA